VTRIIGQHKESAQHCVDAIPLFGSVTITPVMPGAVA
jgi:hypothetical protein